MSYYDPNIPSGQQPDENPVYCPGPDGRVPIARLPLGHDGMPSNSQPRRTHRRHVPRACEPCRQRKTKCTGERGGCHNCGANNVRCFYTDGKREKTKKQFEDLKRKNEEHEIIEQRLADDFGLSVEELRRQGLRNHDGGAAVDNADSYKKRKPSETPSTPGSSASSGDAGNPQGDQLDEAVPEPLGQSASSGTTFSSFSAGVNLGPPFTSNASFSYINGNVPTTGGNIPTTGADIQSTDASYPSYAASLDSFLVEEYTAMDEYLVQMNNDSQHQEGMNNESRQYQGMNNDSQQYEGMNPNCGRSYDF
ncbi:Zn(II)2Cys6 transcription factor domain-containing protein [Aspergillus undulatus]|uniref:Zn(II)2Cys6 transcription factor domain-containing protein n=1 Tax=Aspergillus undulatus TaxID=1810928 RepID=UPI003CCD14D5